MLISRISRSRCERGGFWSQWSARAYCGFRGFCCPCCFPGYSGRAGCREFRSQKGLCYLRPRFHELSSLGREPRLLVALLRGYAMVFDGSRFPLSSQQNLHLHSRTGILHQDWVGRSGLRSGEMSPRASEMLKPVRTRYFCAPEFVQVQQPGMRDLQTSGR